MADTWIGDAISRPGAFTKKAKTAGESVPAYAADKADAPGRLGKQARLAQTLEGMHHKDPKRARAASMAHHLSAKLTKGID